jgi:formate hydrogenlyase transcriptional activator
MQSRTPDNVDARTDARRLPQDASRMEILLRALLEGTATTTGRDFFESLVKHLAMGLGVRYAFIAECLPKERARSLAFWAGTNAGSDFEYDLHGTPCLKVAEGRICHYGCNLQRLFPKDKPLVDLRAESYLGVPVRDSTQRVIGHLVIIDDKPMPQDPLVVPVMEIFAARAGVELERARAFENLGRLHQESEERFRDLFEEAPIAYVHEGLDSRFIRANRAALRILGIKPEEAVGTIGKTLVADTPDNQRRLREAFESIGRGTDTGGVVLEMRRQDNGKPVWIQWWSRPDPSGNYTRTMFIDITERVLMEREKTRLEAQNTYLQEEIRAEHNFTEIVGNSPKLRTVLQQVEQVAATDSTVLLHGETGTGKELFARAIHNRSGRKKRPLVKVNCGAISAGLVESELFGHVKGAFTGALGNRDGRFKVADGGTIFLDEVGELPPETQVKLLRVLQEQEFEPIGSDKSVKVDVRIIAATNRDLDEAVRAGKFRPDLLYRLNVFPIRVPPLRERQGDVPLLVTFFLQNFAKKLGKKVVRVSEETMHQLASYTWPGNIRELQNIVERAVILSAGDILALESELHPAGAANVPTSREAVATSSPAREASTSLEEAERRHIESVLAQVKWVIEGNRGAAKLLKLHPNTLRSRMKKLGLQRPSM